MQIVINISEKDYDTLINHNDDSVTAVKARLNLCESLKNGIVLSKNHYEDNIKVGTRVRILSSTDCSEVTLRPTNIIGIIKQISFRPNDCLPYKITLGYRDCWYSKEMFKVIPDNIILEGDFAKTPNNDRVFVTCVRNDGGYATVMFKDGSFGKFNLDSLTYAGEHCFYIDDLKTCLIN